VEWKAHSNFAGLESLKCSLKLAWSSCFNDSTSFNHNGISWKSINGNHFGLGPWSKDVRW
jgi:hypothetical protein